MGRTHYEKAIAWLAMYCDGLDDLEPEMDPADMPNEVILVCDVWFRPLYEVLAEAKAVAKKHRK